MDKLTARLHAAAILGWRRSSASLYQVAIREAEQRSLRQQAATPSLIDCRVVLHHVVPGADGRRSDWAGLPCQTGTAESLTVAVSLIVLMASRVM